MELAKLANFLVFSNLPDKKSKKNILLIHGFGASKNHWRYNQEFLGETTNCFAIDLLGFGNSSQPKALLDYENPDNNSIKYCFDLWGEQIRDFCYENIREPVILVGNSIGGIVALRAAEIDADLRVRPALSSAFTPSATPLLRAGGSP